MSNSRMYLTDAEAKEQNLPSAQEQIDRWNKAQAGLHSLTYENFLIWHKEAVARCSEGESIAPPSVKFFENWKANRLAVAAHAEMMKESN